jgi:hypothetical protein
MKMAYMLGPDEYKGRAYFLIDGFENLELDFRLIFQSHSILTVLSTLLPLILVIVFFILVFWFLFEEVIKKGLF